MDQLVSKAIVAKVKRNQKKLLITSDMSSALFVVLPSLFGQKKMLFVYKYVYIYIHTYIHIHIRVHMI